MAICRGDSPKGLLSEVVRVALATVPLLVCWWIISFIGFLINSNQHHGTTIANNLKVIMGSNLDLKYLCLILESMPRPLRTEYKDAFYHVRNRGSGRRKVFHTAEYYAAFLKGIEEAQLRFGMEIHAYCLMANHYDLLIKTPRGNLSRVMRHIDGLYTQRHNRLRKSDGALFCGRYKAIVVDANQYLLQLSRYIHRSPLETKKPLVEVLEDYPWSSYATYLGQSQAPPWLSRDAVYAALGNRQRYKAYQIYVNQGIDQEIAEFYRLKHTPSVLGNKQFREESLKRSKSLDREIANKGSIHPVPLARIIRAVANYYQLTGSALKRAKRGQGNRNIPRWIAMKLCQEVGSARLTEIAALFAVSHYSTVSQTIGRLNRLMGENSQYDKDYKAISRDLTP